MRHRGEVTVFLTMILVSIMTLLLVVVESARETGARLYLRMAADSSMDSVMAQYHRGLWENYRILGLETGEKERLEQEFGDFFAPYAEAENWYPVTLVDTDRKDAVMLTEGQGAYFEQEILDYMKFGLIDMIWDSMDENGAREMLSQFKDAEGINGCSVRYEGHTREAVRVEAALEKINGRLEEQRQNWEQGKRCLDDLDGSGLIRRAESMIKILKKLPSLVTAYEKRADRLNEALKESRQDFESREDLSDGSREALREEFAQYETYTEKDGQRRMEIAALREKSRENILFLENIIREAEDVMDYIDSWEPDDEDDELDEEALWAPVRSHFSRYPVLRLGMEFGVKDKEKEGWLERIGDLASKGILELVLPEGTVVSGRSLKLNGFPSKERTPGNPAGEGKRNLGVQTLLDRLLVSEYGIRYFSAFKPEPPSFYQLEYILYGKEKDRENLEASVLRLTALRQGLNLAHILRDPVKREEARSLAIAIAGGTGMAPLAAVLSFFIMTVWALGEALADVRCLLEGGKVPLVKSSSQWKLDLQGLLELGAKGRLPDGIGKGEKEEEGLDHKGYLRLMLFGGYSEERVYRMMDVIQTELRTEQPDFCMAGCTCMVEMEAEFCGKPVFFSGGSWKDRQKIRMAVSGSYLDDE